MYRKFISAMYVLNIVFQALFTLVMPAAFGYLLCLLLIEFAGADPWIYAAGITLGVLIGFYSMIKFVLSAMAGLDRLEKSAEESLREREEQRLRESERGSKENGED